MDRNIISSNTDSSATVECGQRKKESSRKKLFSKVEKWLVNGSISMVMKVSITIWEKSSFPNWRPRMLANSIKVRLIELKVTLITYSTSAQLAKKTFCPMLANHFLNLCWPFKTYVKTSLSETSCVDFIGLVRKYKCTYSNRTICVKSK